MSLSVRVSAKFRMKSQDLLTSSDFAANLFQALAICQEHMEPMVQDQPELPLYCRLCSETAATPMPRMKFGLAKAGSMVKSLSTNSKAPSSSIAGSVPKLGSKGSSFAEELIRQVVSGRHPSEVLSFLEDEYDIERQASDVSPKGSRLHGLIQPGEHIGIRGPVHSGFHTVDSVKDGIVTMKCDDGRMVTVPLSSLDDHEVVHARANA